MVYSASMENIVSVTTGPRTVTSAGYLDHHRLAAGQFRRLFTDTSQPSGKRWTVQAVADACTARGQSVTKADILPILLGDPIPAPLTAQAS